MMLRWHVFHIVGPSFDFCPSFVKEGTLSHAGYDHFRPARPAIGMRRRGLAIGPPGRDDTVIPMGVSVECDNGFGKAGCWDRPGPSIDDDRGIGAAGQSPASGALLQYEHDIRRRDQGDANRPRIMAFSAATAELAAGAYGRRHCRSRAPAPARRFDNRACNAVAHGMSKARMSGWRQGRGSCPDARRSATGYPFSRSGPAGSTPVAADYATYDT